MSATPRIFVSHSHIDNVFGVKLVEDLRRTLGDEDAVWYDALGGLAGGDTWWRKIVEEVTTRPIFIVVLSPAALESQWVQDEIALALKQKDSPAGKVIIPVLYRPCKVPKDLRHLRKMISFVPPNTYEVAFGEVLTALEQIPVAESKRRISRRVAIGTGLTLSVAILTGVIYYRSFGQSTHKKTVAAPRPRPPKLRWRAQTNSLSTSLSSLMVTGGVVYVGDDYSVYAFNADNGTSLWQSNAGNGGSIAINTDPSAPTIAGGVVYMASVDNHLYALDAGTGSLRWQYKAGNSIDIYACGSQRHGLHCFGRPLCVCARCPTWNTDLALSNW